MHWLIIFLEIALNRSLSYETNSFLPLPFQVFEIEHPLGRSHQRFHPKFALENFRIISLQYEIEEFSL